MKTSIGYSVGIFAILAAGVFVGWETISHSSTPPAATASPAPFGPDRVTLVNSGDHAEVDLPDDTSKQPFTALIGNQEVQGWVYGAKGFTATSAVDRPNHKWPFYVQPVLVIDQVDGFKSTEPKQLPGGTAFETTFEAKVLTNEVRDAAAKAAQKYFGVTVQNDDIHLWPYTMIKIMANVGGQPRLVCTVPEPWTIGEDRSSSMNAKLANVHQPLPCKLTGTKEELDAFRKDAKATDISYFAAISGYQVKQNIWQAALSMIAQGSLSQSLAGGADFKDQLDKNQWGADLSIGIGPIAFGGGSDGTSFSWTRKSWVTRDQVKEMMLKAMVRLSGSEWWELDDPKLGAEIRGKMLDTLLSTAKTTELQWDTAQKRLVGNAEIERDFQPDVVQLSHDVGDHLKSNQTKTTSGNATVSGVTVGGSDSWSSDVDMGGTVKSDTGAVIPKSVKLFQFKKEDFDRFMSWDYVVTVATHGNGAVQDTAVISEWRTVTKWVYPDESSTSPRFGNYKEPGNDSPPEGQTYMDIHHFTYKDTGHIDKGDSISKVSILPSHDPLWTVLDIGFTTNNGYSKGNVLSGDDAPGTRGEVKADVAGGRYLAKITVRTDNDSLKHIWFYDDTGKLLCDDGDANHDANDDTQEASMAGYEIVGWNGNASRWVKCIQIYFRKRPYQEQVLELVR